MLPFNPRSYFKLFFFFTILPFYAMLGLCYATEHKVNAVSLKKQEKVGQVYFAREL